MVQMGSARGAGSTVAHTRTLSSIFFVSTATAAATASWCCPLSGLYEQPAGSISTAATAGRCASERASLAPLTRTSAVEAAPGCRGCEAGAGPRRGRLVGSMASVQPSLKSSGSSQRSKDAAAPAFLPLLPLASALPPRCCCCCPCCCSFCCCASTLPLGLRPTILPAGLALCAACRMACERSTLLRAACLRPCLTATAASSSPPCKQERAHTSSADHAFDHKQQRVLCMRAPQDLAIASSVSARQVAASSRNAAGGWVPHLVHKEEVGVWHSLHCQPLPLLTGLLLQEIGHLRGVTERGPIAGRR